MGIKILSLGTAAFIFPVSVFTMSSVLADQYDIARCVDASGEITYTDFYCTTTENANPLLMTEQAIDKPVRSDRLYSDSNSNDSHINTMEEINSGTIASMRLKSVTTEAVNHCGQRFSRFFRRNHPTVSEVPSIEFDEITDRFVKGSDISITVRGTVQYYDQSSTVRSHIECTVQKLSNNDDWMVGFLER